MKNDMDENIIPDEKTKETIYSFYLLAYDSKFPIAKKRHLMTAAMGYEKWGWRVVGITKKAVIEIANNNYRLPKGLQRDHFKKSRSETYNEIFLNKKFSLDEWWETVWANDETILMTKEEHNKHKTLNEDDVIKVDHTLGFFRNKAVVGMEFTKKRDGEFVKKIFEEMTNG